MNVLVISAFYHDSAACLVGGGEVVNGVIEAHINADGHRVAAE